MGKRLVAVAGHPAAMKRLIPLWCLIFLAYSNTFHAQFVFDDIVRMQHPEPSWRQLVHLGNRPLTSALFHLEYVLGGRDPFAGHAIALLLHLATTAIVLALLDALEVSSLSAFFGAAVFGLHPMLTQAVTYISGSASTLCGLFYFFALWMLVLFMKGRHWLTIPVGLISAGLACLAKPEAVALPLAGLAFYYLLGGRRRWPLVAAGLCLIVALKFFLTVVPDYSPLRTFEFRPGTMGVIATNLSIMPLYVLPRYVAPVRQSADPDLYPVHHDNLGVFAFSVLVWLLLLASPLCRGFPLLVRIGLAALAYSPPLFRVFAISALEEHHAYIPALGVAILATFLVKCREDIVGGITILVVLGLLTYARNEVWSTRLTLFQDAASKAKINPRPHMNLGREYLQRGDYAKARDALLRAYQMDPSQYTVENDLAVVAMNRRFWAEAQYWLLDVTRKRPIFPQAWSNLGVFWMAQGRYGEALEAFAHAPAYGVANYHRAELLRALGRKEEADKYFTLAFESMPELRKGQ